MSDTGPNLNTGILVKVKYIDDSELIVIGKDMSLEEFHKKIRFRFGLTPDIETEIHYKKESNDYIVVSSDDVLTFALKNSTLANFELIDKSNPERSRSSSSSNNNNSNNENIDSCRGF